MDWTWLIVISMSYIDDDMSGWMNGLSMTGHLDFIYIVELE